ncbi:MAG: OmpA family protein [Candidatus Brocadiaceae bacterium]|nr:OmpA family protein [Candidatus Brocadiaceae bacterium]
MTPGSRQKKKKVFSSKPPDLFLVSYAGFVTLLLAFFIIINTFTEEKNKKLLEEFQVSLRRNSLFLGMGGVLKGKGDKEREAIREMKYIFPDEKSSSIKIGNEGIKEIEQEEDQLPAAVVIYFDENDPMLTFEGKHSLNTIIDLVQDRPCSLLVEGHCRKNFIASKGYDNSWKLSLDRAKTVTNYLYRNGGISMKRLMVVGYGNNNPLVENIRGDRYNDRVSIVINVLK